MNPPTTVIIFGASGDLSQRKLVPSLFNLFRKDRLPENFNILGFSSSEMDDRSFREKMRTGVDQYAGFPLDEDNWKMFAPHLRYISGKFTQPGDYQRLSSVLKDLGGHPSNHLYYLATPPRFFLEIVERLGESGLVTENEGWRRVVIEKPFGTSAETAHELNQNLHNVLTENQIYRIDHYLGKETVQNILTFRFANLLYEPIWNRNYIDHVQISVAEKVDVGTRAGYYDGIGALRDMFQNHLFQLLSLIAMEPPASFTAHDMWEEKVKVLRAVRPFPLEELSSAAVRGQYLGYHDATGVSPDSTTETYAALRLYIDNWRWQDVPFYLRSGKNLSEKSSEIVIQFKSPPVPKFSSSAQSSTPNLLTFCLQPDEGFHQQFELKVPDTISERRSAEMAFHYKDAFGGAAIPDAYERLLLDALTGDTSLFTRNDWLELAWEILDPVLGAWKVSDPELLYTYEPGGWGPVAADMLLERAGRSWLRVCGIHKNMNIYPLVN